MATCHAVIGPVFSPSGADAPVMAPTPHAAEDITTSVTHVVSTIVVPSDATNLLWCLVSTSAVWVKFGTAPEATPGEDFYLPADCPMYFGAVAGHKVSVEDVS